MSSVQIYKSGKHQYVRIIESYRVPGEKYPKVRILQNLGRYDELEAKEPGIVERLKKEHQQSREAEKTVRQDYVLQNIRNVLKEGMSLSSDGFPLVNYGAKIYSKLWNDLKLDYFFDYRQKKESKIEFKVKDVTSLLVYSRLLDPCSKRRTFEHQSQFLDLDEVEQENIYRALPFLAAQKDNLEKHLNKELGLKMDRNLSIAFYDVTTYYFESVRADDLKKFGYSKDNKVNQVQVVMGLLIDQHGIPISYDLFPGNTNDFSTLEPVMRRLKADYGINKVIVTADRGLNSKKNLAFLKSLGYEYVMAYKIRSSSKAVKDLVLAEGDYTVVSKDYKWKVCDYATRVNFDGEQVQLEDQMVITWSARREAKDKRDRERLVNKSLRLVESKSAIKAEMKKGGKKYVQLSFLEDDQITFDQKKLEYDEQFDGYYGIQYSDASLTPDQVVAIYHGLWKIEESFRVMKSDLEARPIYVWTEDSIRGHFVICYLALVIQRYLEYQLSQQGVKLSTERIQNALRSAQVTVIEDEIAQEKFYIKNRGNADTELIMESLQLKSIPQYGWMRDLKR